MFKSCGRELKPFCEQGVMGSKRSCRASAPEENKDEKKVLNSHREPGSTGGKSQGNFRTQPAAGTSSQPLVRGTFCSCPRKPLQVTPQSWSLVPPAGRTRRFLAVLQSPSHLLGLPRDEDPATSTAKGQQGLKVASFTCTVSPPELILGCSTQSLLLCHILAQGSALTSFSSTRMKLSCWLGSESGSFQGDPDIPKAWLS